MFNPKYIQERLDDIEQHLPLAVSSGGVYSDVYRTHKMKEDGGPIIPDIPHELAYFIVHAPSDLKEALAEIKRLREDPVYTIIEDALRARDEALAEIKRLNELLSNQEG